MWLYGVWLSVVVLDGVCGVWLSVAVWGVVKYGDIGWRVCVVCG